LSRREVSLYFFPVVRCIHYNCHVGREYVSESMSRIYLCLGLKDELLLADDICQ